MNKARRQSVISISMDMRPVHQQATFAHIENAFDHFHVAQVLTRTLDATRKLIWWSRVTRCASVPSGYFLSAYML
ncbi:transposase [Marinobacter segnicrescens]|uniref:transposase n=1 Tax=Marinobacter segnicrescens TaxID=430453 RepID=UPI000B86C3C4